MPQKIHIVTEPSWICRSLATHLQSIGKFRVRVTTDPPCDADLTYYLTYLFREFYRPAGKAVGLFTHFVPGQHQKRYDQLAKQMDHCIVLNETHRRYLEDRVGKHRVSRVHLPVMNSPEVPPLRVGWFHRSPEGYGRRKRTDLLDFVRKLPWTKVVQSDGKMTQQRLAEAMRSVDVFLTTSDYESGPSCLVEALALGKSVVIPQGVGLADEYAHLPTVHSFPPGDAAGLEATLEDCYKPLKMGYEAVARNNTVDRWRADHVAIFQEVLS